LAASLFDPLLAEGLTSLRIRHDWRTGRSGALASKDWEPDLAFGRYAADFDLETELTGSPVLLDDSATRALYRREGAEGALDGLLDLLREGRHQGIDLWVHSPLGIRVISNMHSDVPGLGNGRHAIRAGGIRRHGPADAEEEVLVDGLNLARAMSFKNVAARVPYGGSKICVHSEPVALDDLEALGFLAWCIDRSRSCTGPDMGFDPRHADVLRAHFTRAIVGGPAGALGPTGAPTARGVLLALRGAVSDHLGRDGLAGLSVAIQGLGAVGAPLATALLGEGVSRLLVADQEACRRASFLDSLGEADRARTEVVDPTEVLTAEVDILSPNAVGGVLGPDEIDALRCRIVMGAANNQLRAVSQAEELALAERLDSRGVLYQVDWMHNSAGVIAGCEEYEHQESASMERVEAHLEQVCGEGVAQNLAAARSEAITPTAMAYTRVAEAIYPGEGQARGEARA